MTNPLPRNQDTSPGHSNRLRAQAKKLRERADQLEADLASTDATFGRAFEKHDQRESVIERIARTARSVRKDGLTR